MPSLCGDGIILAWLVSWFISSYKHSSRKTWSWLLLQRWKSSESGVELSSRNVWLCWEVLPRSGHQLQFTNKHLSWLAPYMSVSANSIFDASVWSSMPLSSRSRICIFLKFSCYTLPGAIQTLNRLLLQKGKRKDSADDSPRWSINKLQECRSIASSMIRYIPVTSMYLRHLAFCSSIWLAYTHQCILVTPPHVNRPLSKLRSYSRKIPTLSIGTSSPSSRSPSNHNQFSCVSGLKDYGKDGFGNYLIDFKLFRHSRNGPRNAAMKIGALLNRLHHGEKYNYLPCETYTIHHD